MNDLETSDSNSDATDCSSRLSDVDVDRIVAAVVRKLATPMKSKTTGIASIGIEFEKQRALLGGVSD